MENFSQGCFLVSRSITDSPVFHNEKLLKVWIWCLKKANFTEKREVPVVTGKGVTIVALERGQFIFGRGKAASELHLPHSTVRNLMSRLKRMGNVDIQVDNHYSIVTICNYEAYQKLQNYKGQALGQPHGQAKDRQRTGKGQAKDTDNNVKNLKKVNNVKNDLEEKDKKEKYGELENVNLFPEQYKKLVEKLGEEETKEKIIDLDLYISSKGDKYKCHYSTILTWDRKDKKENKPPTKPKSPIGGMDALMEFMEDDSNG